MGDHYKTDTKKSQPVLLHSSQRLSTKASADIKSTTSCPPMIIKTTPSRGNKRPTSLMPVLNSRMRTAGGNKKASDQNNHGSPVVVPESLVDETCRILSKVTSSVPSAVTATIDNKKKIITKKSCDVKNQIKSTQVKSNTTQGDPDDNLSECENFAPDDDEIITSSSTGSSSSSSSSSSASTSSSSSLSLTSSSQDNSDSEDVSSPSDEGMFSGGNSCCLSSISSSSELSTSDDQSWPPSQKDAESEHEDDVEEEDQNGEETNGDEGEDLYGSEDDYELSSCGADDDMMRSRGTSFSSVNHNDNSCSAATSNHLVESTTLVINGRHVNISSERYAVLTYDQVIRLDSVMDQVMPVHGKGNFPTLEVRLKDLVRVVKSKLNSDGVVVRDIRLNGGAASFVLSSTEEEDSYTDLDLIFGVDLSNHRNFDKVRSAVLDSLLDFLPPGVNKKRMSSCTLKEAYVHKMVKVTENKDRWSLISLCNNRGRDVEIKFVDTMKRQFEFSVDSFQIILDSLLLFYECNCDSRMVMTENMYPTVVGESVYGNFNEALRHLKRKVISTRNPEEIRGGGLLKYCRLMVMGYQPVRYDEIKNLERYMCSRFFIDFSDINVQRMKLSNYLNTHFGDNDQIKYDYLRILYDVVDESTVCLMGHERRQTLALIEEFATHFYYQNQQQNLTNCIKPSSSPLIHDHHPLHPNQQQSMCQYASQQQTPTPRAAMTQTALIQASNQSNQMSHHHNNSHKNHHNHHHQSSSSSSFSNVTSVANMSSHNSHPLMTSSSSINNCNSNCCNNSNCNHSSPQASATPTILMTTTSNGTTIGTATGGHVYYTPIHHPSSVVPYGNHPNNHNQLQTTTLAVPGSNNAQHYHHHHYYVQTPTGNQNSHAPPPLIQTHPSVLQSASLQNNPHPHHHNPQPANLGCLNCGHCSTVWMPTCP